MAPKLLCGMADVSRSAWEEARRVMRLRQAVIALLVIDRNRMHTTRPVDSVGGALRALTRLWSKGLCDEASLADLSPQGET